MECGVGVRLPHCPGCGYYEGVRYQPDDRGFRCLNCEMTFAPHAIRDAEWIEEMPPLVFSSPDSVRGDEGGIADDCTCRHCRRDDSTDGEVTFQLGESVGGETA